MFYGVFIRMYFAPGEQCIELILLFSRYYDRDFNKAFDKLKQLTPFLSL
jgi:hypothetical protein